ncbi:MAG: DNA gyrase inhibitor YacG [Methylococcales bacterium]|nr:DNA gyrase inhibitor YacG [Methylococcales bacterium]
MSILMHVKCPQCAKPVLWAPTSQYRPFCSERCQMLDLGAWAAESHRIPGESLQDIWPGDEGDDEVFNVES